MRQKNDDDDAEAIANAALRSDLWTVSEKNHDRLDLQSLHQVRARLVSRRTATTNQIRAVLIAKGITVRSGLCAPQNSFETTFDQRRDVILLPMRGILIGSMTGQTNRRCLRRDRTDQPHRRELTQHHNDTRHRPDDLDVDGRGRRQRRNIRPGPRFRGTGWPHAPTRQHHSRQDHQTRQTDV